MKAINLSAQHRAAAGFTLVEIMIVMLIIGIVAAIVAEAFITTTRTTVSMNRRSAVAFSLQEGAEKMVDQLRRASAIIDASPESIEVTLAGQDVIFAFDAGNNRITRNDETLVGDVTGLLLSFYDASGTETDVIDDIRSVKVIINGSSGNEPWQLNTLVSLRKLHYGSVN